jgi:hypothetical protein
VVAKPSTGHLDGHIWIVAQRKYLVYVMGKLSRDTFSSASAMASLAAQIEMGAARRDLDANIVAGDHNAHQRGVDLVPGQFTAASDSDAGGGCVTSKLR